MNKRNIKYYTLPAVIMILLIILLTNEDLANKIIPSLGRLHPLVLHLPIGALILTFFLYVLSRLKGEYPKNIITIALGFSSFFSILACIFGYILSLEGGYTEQTLDIHLWVGILTAVLITLLFAVSTSKSKRPSVLFLPLFIVTICAISVAGHYGSVLTHGSDFLTEFMESPEIEKPITNIDSLKLYDNVVHKIFDNKCIECHNTTKKKGGLSLVSKHNLLLGGDSGMAIEKHNAHESLLFELCTLPITDDDHMPPEGKPQLTKKELWLIKYWINTSDDRDDKVASLPKNDTLNNYLKDYLIIDEILIKEATEEAITAVIAKGFTIRKLTPKNGGLWITYKNKKLPDDGINCLIQLKDQIVELDLGNTDLSDDMTDALKSMQNLVTLKLNKTDITDITLHNLTGLKQLKRIVLHNTNIGNEGIKILLDNITPNQIYAWQTNIDYNNLKLLKNEFVTRINLGMETTK
ncbi:putative membrane protein [Arenibacter algicola]|uniref:Membrane protein n=1 Tax=Arenibacter algicola TaxID=616991 RepID=A0ABY3ACR3_9FLAO